jgi:branched-chain amino acid transport system permease protein
MATTGSAEAAMHASGGRRTFGLTLLGLLVAVALAFPIVFQFPYHRDLAIKVLLFAMLAQAWNILAGYCGQVSLGHAVFFGTGAYTSSVLQMA